MKGLVRVLPAKRWVPPSGTALYLEAVALAVMLAIER